MRNALLKNPLTLWLRWLGERWQLRRMHGDRHLAVGYMARAKMSSFGYRNTLHEHALLVNCHLGDFSYVGRSSRLANVTAGKFCSVGPEVLAGIGMHPSRDYLSTHPIFYSTLGQGQLTLADVAEFEEFKPIAIGNDVWIGARAIILDGVNIGNGAIIGAGSVVTEDVPAYAIVTGVPARIVRYRFTPGQIAWVESFRWWDRDLDWIRSNYRSFHDVNAFADEFASTEFQALK